MSEDAHSDNGGDGTLYVGEVLHRVSNEYMNAVSFAHDLAAHSVNEETKAAVLKVAEHLNALAEAQHALRPPASDGPTDFADRLSHLCQAMTSAWLAPREISLQLQLSGPIMLGEQKCWRACLIAHEFITNASRHAVFSHGGHIVVSGEVVCGRIICRVSDDGSFSAAHVPGAGSRLVNALAGQLEGIIESRFGTSGATAVLSFPVDPPATGEMTNGKPAEDAEGTRINRDR